MTIKLPAHVVAFAAGDASLYEMYVDFWNQYKTENNNLGKKYNFTNVDKEGKLISFAQKEDALNAALRREVGKRAGVDFDAMPVEQAMTHPMVGWALMNIASNMIEAILPDTLIESTTAYAEIRQMALGETAVWDISSRDLFPVSKSGRLGMREAEMHKGYEGQVVLNPEFRTMTVGVNLFRVLTGQESLAKFTLKALRSLETAMTKDIYDVFAAAMLALSTTATTGLRVTGYTQADLIKLSQKVSAWNGGAAPVVLGTKAALNQVLPDDGNYRYDLNSPYVTLGYVRTIAGINTIEVPQVADWTNPFSVYLSDASLWIVAPGTDKIVKVALGGSIISNTTGMFDAATLQQNATMMKSWKAGVVTSAVGGLITL